MILRNRVALQALAPYSLLMTAFVSSFFLLPPGSGWHRHNDWLLLGRSAGDEFVCWFPFLFDAFVSGAGAIETPAVPGGPGVFIAPCVS